MIIKRVREAKTTLGEYTGKYEAAFLEDLRETRSGCSGRRQAQTLKTNANQTSHLTKGAK